MKQLLLLLLSIPFLTTAQNVGINNPNPAEKLDVTGNVNITGTIKTNGLSGAKGQFLMSTGPGMTWGSTAGYKKCVVFVTAGSGIWSVPAGVTDVMVELWGGGSGGSAFRGGPSGGYARSVLTVAPGDNISYTVGSGGSSGSTTSTGGSNSTISFSGGSLAANAGGAIVAGGPGTVGSGTSSGLDNAFFMPGSFGTANFFSYGQRTSVIYVEVRQYGSGGIAPGMLNTSVQPGDLHTFENGSLVTSQFASHAKTPGSGGSAGSGSGWNGAPGMIVFWFNN